MKFKTIEQDVLIAYLKAYQQHGSYRPAAAALNVNESTIRKHVSKLLRQGFNIHAVDLQKEWISVTATHDWQPDLLNEDPDYGKEKQAAQQNSAPDYDVLHPAPPGMISRGVSNLYREDGTIAQAWYKTKQQGQTPEESLVLPEGRILKESALFDNQGRVMQRWVQRSPNELPIRDAVKATVTSFLEGVNVAVPLGPDHFDRDVIPWFQIGDAHIGMLAHEAETGANFDLKIAERELCAAIAILIDECPPRERCVINDLGDMTHIENMGGYTEASRNALDFDGRFPKIIRVYSRVMRFIVDRALTKFKFLDLIINQGNHSRTNDVIMAEMMTQIYGPSGRVNVLDNSSAFIPYRMGNTFVMTHHSDKTKPEKLRQVMCQDYRQDWGETEFRYIDVGHLHHKLAIKEDAGCTIEMWNTLAGKDKWHHDGGYRGAQSITRVDRSRTYGEVGRRVLPIREIRDIISRSHSDVYLPPERRLVYSV